MLRLPTWALGLTLLLLLVLQPLALTPCQALTLPWSSSSRAPAASQSTSRPSALQEVAPPLAVQQLQAALAGHEPLVEILSPQDDAILGGDPWTLKLRLRDWPLVDAGALGLGPHLVVQIDQAPPRRWTQLEGQLPPLSPGSHRLSVYAAYPWGEASRNPGAVRQIRLHRTAANPLSVPAPHSPQLLAVSPPQLAGPEPLLFDFLVLDAPLQNVGGSGTQWRLRLDLNGEQLLLDQQSPLWLRGWKAGVNALQLELLDGQGEALNPPFNALVQEVNRSAGGAPRWSGPALSEQELAVLSGRTPPPAIPAAARPPGSAPPTGQAASSESATGQGERAPLQPAAPQPDPGTGIATRPAPAAALPQAPAAAPQPGVPVADQPDAAADPQPGKPSATSDQADPPTSG